MGCGIKDYSLKCNNCIPDSTFSPSSSSCECNTGYGYSDIKPARCKRCPENCIKCSFDHESHVTCHECNYNHFLAADNNSCKSVQSLEDAKIKAEAESKRLLEELKALEKIAMEKTRAVLQAKAKEEERKRSEEEAQELKNKL